MSGMEVKVFSSSTAAILSLFWDLHKSGVGEVTVQCYGGWCSVVLLYSVQCGITLFGAVWYYFIRCSVVILYSV